MVKDRTVDLKSNNKEKKHEDNPHPEGHVDNMPSNQNKDNSVERNRSSEVLDLLEKLYCLTEKNQTSVAAVAANMEQSSKQGDLIKSLFAKVDSLERDTVFRDRIRPVLLDMIRLYDRVELMCGEIAEPVADNEALSVRLNSIRSELSQILKRNGVEELDVLHRPFDESFSEAADKKRVNDPALHMKTVEVLRKAFLCHGRLLRPALVLVGECKPENGDVSDE